MYAVRCPVTYAVPSSLNQLTTPFFACLLDVIKITTKTRDLKIHFDLWGIWCLFFFPWFWLFLIAFPPPTFLCVWFWIYFFSFLHYQVCRLWVSCSSFISYGTVAILHLFFIGLCVWFVLEVSILQWVTPRQCYHFVLEELKKKSMLFWITKK